MDKNVMRRTESVFEWDNFIKETQVSLDFSKNYPVDDYF